MKRKTFTSEVHARRNAVRHADVDFEALIREAQLERSAAIGNAIGSVVGLASRGIERAFALIAHGVSAAWVGHATQRPSGTRR